MNKYEIELSNLEASYILWLALNTNKKPEAIIKELVLSSLANVEMTVLTSQLRKGASES